MHSSSAVRMAVGCLVELAFKVAAGELKVSVCGLAGVGVGGATWSCCRSSRGWGSLSFCTSRAPSSAISPQVQVRGGGDSSRRAGGEG